MCTIEKKYLYEFQKERYDMAISRDLKHLEDNEVSTIEVEDGYIIPVKKNNNNHMFGDGGVLDRNGRYIPESSHRSYGGFFSQTEAACEQYVGNCCEMPGHVERCEETVIFCGYINNHWGHFLIDFSSRLWYPMIEKKHKVVFILKENENFKLIQQIKDFLVAIEISNVEFLNRPRQYSKVIVPEQSYVTNFYYTDKHLKMFDKVVTFAMAQSSRRVYPEKIYFARTQYKKAIQSEIGEDILIEVMKNNGFEIISPEKETLFEQIRLIRNAEIIAGIAGTIPHNMLFAERRKKIMIFNKTYIINLMQMDINVMRDLDVTYIDSYVCVKPVSLGEGPFLLYNTKLLKSFCQDYNLRPVFGSNKSNGLDDYLDLLYYSKYSSSTEFENPDSVHFFPGQFSTIFLQEYFKKVYKPSIWKKIRYYMTKVCRKFGAKMHKGVEVLQKKA